MRAKLTKSMGMGVLCTVLAVFGRVDATEFHVAVPGNDQNPGTEQKPLRTIQRGAELAQPGDTVTVHAGCYRERVNPPRGGESDVKRIVYQAAPGEKVVIKGSELVKGWEKVQSDVWKVVLPNSFFGAFNPYEDYIRGDWFCDTDWTGRTNSKGQKGRRHHTGAVYLNGDWLVEAATLDEVLAVKENKPAKPEHLFNILWFKTKRVDAQNQATKASSCERARPTSVASGQCLAFIEDGGFAEYEKVDFGVGSDEIEFCTASPGNGGLIEVRMDGPGGELLGTCWVPGTMGWENWGSSLARIKPVNGVHRIYLGFKKKHSPGALDNSYWYAKVGEQTTTLWAQFKGANPNAQEVEINVRQSVFYPDKPGRNYITVRGFTMRDAATPWAPPTAEQIGLLGVHWSKGWIIENNTISHSICVGITLGKYGDQFDNASHKRLAAERDPSFTDPSFQNGVDPSYRDGALAYNRTVERAIKGGWSRDTIGSHLVKNNVISFCEQAGIVGSMGAIYSTIAGNEIHDIHVRNLFYGDEVAGIKFHAPIDVQITGNHIYRTCKGIWQDWMTQGTRVSRNLLHNNGSDLVFEIDHGPCLVDNNLLLSGCNIDAATSRGFAYVHNLLAGDISGKGHDKRKTPFYKPHSTTFAGLHEGIGGDDRFYNNLITGGGGNLGRYDKTELPCWMGGNVFLNGAQPSSLEKMPVVDKDYHPDIQLVEREDGWFLTLKTDKSWSTRKDRDLITTALLGKALVPEMAFEQPDGAPLRIDTDYFGKNRNTTNPTPGPFEKQVNGTVTFKVW